MDLKEIWQGLDEAQFSGGIEDSQVLQRIRKASKHPLEKLRKGLLTKLWWGGGVGGALLLLCILAMVDAADSGEDWIVVWGLVSVLMLVSVGMMVPVWRAWKSLPREVDLSGEVLGVMKQFRDTVRRVLRLELKFAWIMAFPSPAVGALLGLMSDGDTIAELAESGKIWSVLVIGVAVAPLVIWLTRRMNNYAFGKTLAEVEGYIEELEREEMAGEA